MRTGNDHYSRYGSGYQFLLLGVAVLLLSTVVPVRAQEGTGAYYTVKTVSLADGSSLEKVVINSPPIPPPGFDVARRAVSLPAPDRTAGVNRLTVPAFTWVFGCSAVSGAMIAGYHDRAGWPDIYTGPANGGVMPLDNSSWPTWSDGETTYPSCPLIASRNGVDGRTTRGSIDDYWVRYNSNANDPYITSGWTEHAWGDAIGDYMKTSQSAYGNVDGATAFYNWTNSANPLTCSDMEGYNIHQEDGTYGRKLFYEARGYTVTDCYSQKTDNTIAGGFSFAQFKGEIDAGRPVFLNLAGHSIVGVGYDDATNLVYLHDTWDYSDHTMTWGTSYSGMQLQSVSIVNLATYTVSFNSNGGSHVPDQFVPPNEKATRPADPTRAGYTFADWYADSGLVTVFDFDTSITANITLYAKWTANSPVSVMVNTSPAGRSFIVDGTTYSAAQTFAWPQGSSHTIATSSPQTLSGTRYVFANWSDGGAQSHDITVTAASDGAIYTASFATEHQLLISVSPAGKGTVSPASGGWYPHGAEVSVGVTPGKNYIFSSWTGPVVDANSNPTTVLITEPVTITAILTGKPSLTPSILAKSGTAGGVREWTILLVNSGKGPATNARLTGLTLSQTSGAACNPVVKTVFPVSYGNIPVGAGADRGVSIDFTGCASSARFTATISHEANGGVRGSKTFRNQAQ